MTTSYPFPFHRHALALALTLAMGTAQAITIEASGTCSLVNAIKNANTDTDTDGVGGCPAGNGPDTLNLLANKVYTLHRVNNRLDGPNGLPVISSVITINGNGSTIKRSSAVGTPDFRLLRIANNGNLSINTLRLTNGRLSGNYQYGGAIHNSGQLTMSNCTISGNSAVGVGASGSGIADMYQSTLTLNNCTIVGNKASRGGGIVNFPQSTATINNSTIFGNISNNGGIAGIGNGGTMTLTNSTVSSNRNLATWGVGGISNSSDGTLTLNHTTIANNSTEYGSVAGVANSGSMTLINSIISDSKNGGDCYTNTRYGGSVTLQGQSIVEDGTCNATRMGDPKLAPLLDNGGPTLTHALLNTSPAINAANALCVNIDQRYVSRPQPTSGICDIGAFEKINIKPTNIKPLLQFFDGQVRNGLVGVEPLATYKLNAVRHQLLTASDNKSAQLNDQACKQLAKTLLRIDIDANNPPDKNDYVTGSQSAELISRINSLRTTWGCQ